MVSLSLSLKTKMPDEAVTNQIPSLLLPPFIPTLYFLPFIFVLFLESSSFVLFSHFPLCLCEDLLKLAVKQVQQID